MVKYSHIVLERKYTLIQFSILTVSDKGSAGLREGTSGKTIEEIMLSAGHQLVEYAMVPDERAIISRH
jgi:molybdopterin adenylyltransferase